MGTAKRPPLREHFGAAAQGDRSDKEGGENASSLVEGRITVGGGHLHAVGSHR